MSGRYVPGGAAAQDLQPGQTVFNPNVGWQGDDRETLDVVSVSAPDDEGMVTIFCLDGPPVYIAGDWGMEIMTAADADLRASLLLGLNDEGATGGRHGG